MCRTYLLWRGQHRVHFTEDDITADRISAVFRVSSVFLSYLHCRKQLLECCWLSLEVTLTLRTLVLLLENHDFILKPNGVFLGHKGFGYKILFITLKGKYHENLLSFQNPKMFDC